MLKKIFNTSRTGRIIGLYILSNLLISASSFGQAPANDNTCNATQLVLGLNSPFSNVNATTQTNEPVISTGTCTNQGNWCSGEPLPQLTNTVWFKFTVPAGGTGSYAFRVNGNGGQFDAQAALFYAASCTDLTNGTAVRVAANDDSTSGLFNVYMTSFCLTPTFTYYLLVDGYGGTTNSNFFVHVIELPDRNAVANAGPDQTICYSLFPQVAVNGSLLGVAGSTTWTSTGDGTFANPSSLSTTYSPGNSDKLTGQARLVLSTNDPAGVCNASRDTLVLTIIADSINAGPDRTICNGQQYIKMNGAANLFTSYQWYTTGDGTFLNSNLLNADYFPGTNDKVAANYKLVLSGVSTQCFNTVYDTLTVTNASGTNPVVNLGPDRSVCVADSFQITPVALSSFSSLQWKTNGDGHFNNTNTSPVYYTPGPNEKLTGNVVVSLAATGVNPCQGIIADTLKITITQPAQITGFTSGSTFCSSGSIVITANVNNYSGLQWSTSGTGTFSTQNTLSTIYNPSANDIIAGTITITLNATSVSPCSSVVSSQKVINITPAPTVTLNVPSNSCSNNVISVNAVVANYQTLTWSSSGNGIFTDPFSTKPKYTPGSVDLANGYVTFTVIVIGNNPCNAFSFNATTNLTPDPTVNAGADQVVCVNGNVSVNAIASNSSSVEWSTGGDGNFVNASSLSAIYIPGTLDSVNGYVNLFIVAHGISPCVSAATDQLLVTFASPVIADAGVDIDIVDGMSVTLQPLVQNSGSRLWTTNGDGTFNNASLLNAVYTPGTNDRNAGSVVLKLKAFSAAPCTGSDSDFVTINIFPDALFAVRFYIEGYYRNGAMDPVLYNSSVSSNTNLTDHFVLQLHDTLPPFSIAHQENLIVATNGFAFTYLPTTLAGKWYYVSIKSRNSIETWSKFPVMVSAFGLIDFTK